MKDAQRKKTKKARRSATLVKRAEAGTWDEAARREYLTGFRKRKRERRIRGHAYEALKERQAKLEVRAARRAATQERLETLVLPEETPAPASKSTVVYDDAEVMDQWGAEVTVTTTLGLDAPESATKAGPSRQEMRRDVAQLRAGSLEAMRTKVAARLGGSAKAARRAALRRDRKAAAKGGKTLGRTRGANRAAAPPSSSTGKRAPRRASE